MYKVSKAAAVLLLINVEVGNDALNILNFNLVLKVWSNYSY